MNVDQIGSDRKKRRFGPGLEYPNVNLNSISLYKGVFMEPLGDKFFWLIASTFSSDLTRGWCGTQWPCCHLQHPIRAQYSYHMISLDQWDLGSSREPRVIRADNITHHYNCGGIRQTSVNTLQCLEHDDSLRHPHLINDYLGSLSCLSVSISLILFAPSLSNTGDKRCTKFWITNKLLRTILLSVCLISLILLWLTCT